MVGKELERQEGETTLFVGTSIGDESQGVRVPVSRDRTQPLRTALLANATGLRQSSSRAEARAARAE